MKRIINLNVDIDKEIIISSLSVFNDHLIVSFKLNVFKATISDETVLRLK